MNAYELADKLQELDSKLHLINLFKSADMLRQQADRIAELEQTIKSYTIRSRGKSDIQPFADVISKQADRIAELEKEVKELHKIAQVMAMKESDARKSLQNYKDTNAEPVAWVELESWLSNECYPDDCFGHEFFTGAIPLYTTPQTKPLSDSDLDKLVKTAESLKHMEQYIVGLIDGFNHARKLLGQ